jgi:DNA-binding NarL/FixJ family response regulator
MQTARSAPPLRIALVEDDVRFSDMLASAIGAAPDMQLAARVATVAAGQRLLQGPPADVLLVDLGLPDGSGVLLIRAARGAWPHCDVMVYSVFGDEASVIRSIEAGATGYLLKDTPAPRMVEEIRHLRAGGSPISPRIARHVLMRLQKEPSSTATPTAPSASSAPAAPAPPAPPAPVALSQREQEVLAGITRGFTYDEIAHRMGITRHTVQTFVRRIYAKLEVSSKIEAINKVRGQPGTGAGH